MLYLNAINICLILQCVCVCVREVSVRVSLITQITSKSLRSACVMDLSDASLTFTVSVFNYATGSVST